MSDSKVVNDIVNAVKANEAYVNAASELTEADREAVEETVNGFAAMLAPLVETLDELERSEDVMKAVRERLSEKLRGR